MVSGAHSLIAQVEQQGRPVRGRRHAILPRRLRGRNVARTLRREAHAPVAAGAAALGIALHLFDMSAGGASNISDADIVTGLGLSTMQCSTESIAVATRGIWGL